MKRSCSRFAILATSLCLLECTLAPSPYDASLLPRASDDATEVMYVTSNVNCAFSVDDKPTANGRWVRFFVSKANHKVVCQPNGYRAKEEYIQYPFSPAHPIGFTFLLEDRIPSSINTVQTPLHTTHKIIPPQVVAIQTSPVSLPPAITVPIRKLAVLATSDRKEVSRVVPVIDWGLSVIRSSRPEMVLVEREALNHLLDEMARQYGGSVEETSAVRIGRLTGAETLMIYGIDALPAGALQSAIRTGQLSASVEIRLLQIEQGLTLYRQAVTATAAIAMPDTASSADVWPIYEITAERAAWFAIAGLLTALGDNMLGIVPDFSNQNSSGVVILGLLQGGVAGAAGLKSGDTIVSVDGALVTNWISEISSRTKLSLTRDGKQLDIQLREATGMLGLEHKR